MALVEKIDKEYIRAYKNGEASRVGVLRLLKTAAKNKLVELRRPQGVLTDEEMLDVITKQAKQRKDSIEQYLSVGRQDLADREAEELAILSEYLPRALNADELRKLVEEAINETGASGPRDMGKVISRIMASHKGAVDGKELSAVVRERLTAS